jgi:biotin operon repressor
MSLPILTESVGGVNITWADYPFIARVRQIHAHRDGRVTGELTIYILEQDKEKLVYPTTQLNMVAERTRQSLAKSIETQLGNSNYPWQDIIYQICQKVLDYSRKGDPGEILEVIEGGEIIPPTYLLEPVIMAGIPTVIFGEKGVHKTTLCLLFTLCISLPWYDNPFDLKTNSRRSEVGMLDWESDKSLTMFTLQRLLNGSGLPSFALNYRRCTLPLADDIEQIGNFLDDKKCDTILLDSMGAACGGDLMKPEFALRFFQALRSLNRTSLNIAQTSKSEEGKKTIFGSTYFQYYSRNIFELKKSSDVYDKDETKVALFHNEGNYSRKYDPMGFRLSFTPLSIQVEREPIDFGEFMERVNRQKQVVETLKDGPLSTDEIKDKLEISRANADMLTKRLRDKKKIIKTEDGKWGLLIGKD